MLGFKFDASPKKLRTAESWVGRVMHRAGVAGNYSPLNARQSAVHPLQATCDDDNAGKNRQQRNCEEYVHMSRSAV